MGVFLTAPWDWCAGRIHAFGLGYGAVLLGGAVAAVLVLVGSFIGLPFASGTDWRARLKSLSRTAVRCLVVFGVAAVLTPVLELSMPLKADPVCQRPTAHRRG